MKPSRWTNCFADVEACKHDLTIQSYFSDVIIPALATLEAKIADLTESEWPGAVFAHADMQVMLRESKIAFGLSIQSIWERQLRTYLRGCVRDLRPGEGLNAKIERANWKELQKWFRDLRGIRLDAFPSFQTLDTLQHLGNACRHGDGESAAELARRCPDMWPMTMAIPPMPHMPPDAPAPQIELRVALMNIPVERLRDFVVAHRRPTDGKQMNRAAPGQTWRRGTRSAPMPPDGKPCPLGCRPLSQSDSGFRALWEIGHRATP